MARRIILSWPLKLKWRELNKKLPPVMWHGLVGADDSSLSRHCVRHEAKERTLSGQW